MMRSAESTFSTKTDAAKYLARVQTDQSGGVWTDPKLGRITFAAWSEQYLAGAVNKRVTTLAQDRARLRRHLLPFFGSMPLASITPLEVRRFVTALVDAGYLLASRAPHLHCVKLDDGTIVRWPVTP